MTFAKLFILSLLWASVAESASADLIIHVADAEAFSKKAII